MVRTTAGACAVAAALIALACAKSTTGPGPGADCNGCGGGYQLSGGAVTVGILACTRAFCPASAPFDTEYVRIVESATTVARGGDTLTLRSAAGALRFVR